MAPRRLRLQQLERAHQRRIPQVSIIVAATDEAAVLRQSLRAIADHTRGVSYELLLFDNGSRDDTGRLAASLEGDVVTLSVDEPIEMSEAYQRAVERAQGAHVVLMSADAIVEPGWLTALLHDAEQSGAAMVAPMLLLPSGRVHSAGFGLEGAQPFPRSRGATAGAMELRRPFAVEAIGGSVCLVQRSVLREHGLTPGLGLSAALLRLSDALRTRAVLRVEPRAAVYLVGRSHELEATRERHRALVARSTAPPPASWRTLQHDGVARLARDARDAMFVGDYEKATAVVRRLERDAAAHPETWLVRGVLAMQMGQHELALESFIGAEKRGGNAYRSRLGCGMALTAAGRLEEAWNLLYELSDGYPAEEKLAHALFRVGVALRRWRELIPPLSRYVKNVEHDHAMRFALASVFLRGGEAEQAAEQYRELRRRAPRFHGLAELEAELR
ncbi:MAG: glycosyltransferase [Myxococcota bacterium]